MAWIQHQFQINVSVGLDERTLHVIACFLSGREELARAAAELKASADANAAALKSAQDQLGT